MNWADLPEILDLILSKLSDNDSINFSLVCKSWEAAALVAPRPRSSPCLMSYQKRDRIWKLFKYNRFFNMKTPQLDSTDILYSKYGWLLMSRDQYEFFMFNPFDEQILKIPEADYPYQTICFFNPPTSPDCLIVGLKSVRKSDPCVSVGVLKLGEDEWNHFEYNCRTQFIMSDCTPILHRGLLYILDVEGNIGTLDIERQSNWTIYNKCLRPTRLRSKIQQLFFLKLHGDGEEEELFAVLLTHDERKVNVYKLLEPDMKWELVVNLGDKILFVSRTSSFGGTATIKSTANRIYFPNDKLFYSLDSKKYLPFDGDCDFPHHKGYGFKYLKHATWIIAPPIF